MVRRALAVSLLALFACDAPASGPAPSTAPPPATAKPTATASATVAVTASATPEPPPPKEEPWLAERLREGDPRWTGWLEQAEELKLQILVRVVDPRATKDEVHRFRVDAEYVYPASAIKPFVAIAAIRRLNAAVEGEAPLNASIMRCRDDKGGCEPPKEDVDRKVKPREDGKKKHKKLFLSQEIHKLLAWSDNDAYNRLWDFVGHREINEEMAAMGFGEVRLHHRMSAPADRSRKTLRTTLLPPGKRGVVMKRRVSDLELSATPAKKLLIGKAYNDAGKIVEEPLDFGSKNYASLLDLQRIMIAMVTPDHPDAVDLGLGDKQQKVLLKAMKRRPRKGRHADHAPLFPGLVETAPLERIEYLSKSGRAYGFQLENAYIRDTETNRAVFVVANVYGNPNGVLNDNVYAYDETTRPLMAALGETIGRILMAKPRDP